MSADPSPEQLLLLVAYADGQLPVDAASDVEARLAGSAALRNRLEDIRALQAGLRTHLPAAPRALDPARRRAVLAAAQPLRIGRWRTVRWIAAACLAIAALGFLLPLQRLGRPAPASYSEADVAPLRVAPIVGQAGQAAALAPRAAGGLSRAGEQAPMEPPMGSVDLDDRLSSAGVPLVALDEDETKNERFFKESADVPAESVAMKDFKQTNNAWIESRPSIAGRQVAEADWQSADGDVLAGKKGDLFGYTGTVEALKKTKERRLVAGGAVPGNAPAEPAKPAAPSTTWSEVGAASGTVTPSLDLATASAKRQHSSEERLKSATRAVDGLEKVQAPQAENGTVATWRAPLQAGDLAEREKRSLQNHMAVDDALAALAQTGQQAEAQQAFQRPDDGKATITLDGRLTRGEALLQTARAGGRQLRLLPDGIEVAPDRRPLDPTASLGLSTAEFREAFGATPMSVIATAAAQTFAFTADTASFDRAEAQLRDGQSVDAAAIRAEHFVNAVLAGYPPAGGPEAFALYAEAGPSPFAAGALAPRTALVSVGAVARPAGADERRPLALTLAIDCSGSMAQPGGLDRVRIGLAELIARLGDDDSVAVVAFGDRARVVLPAVSGRERPRIMDALAALQAEGSTNAGEGLSLAYQLAAESAKPGRESRVLLATDGATLAGDGAAPVLARIAADRARGISLVVVGCGGRQYQGAALDALAAQGDGQHVYVGSDAEARTLFGVKLVPERLAVLARDAKVQVTWNPQRVTHARLIGFETRRLNARDFRNDAVDAGEIAHDTQATALFEVVLADGGSGPLGSAAVRYLDTRLGAVRELACPLAGSLVASRPSQRLRLMACSADLADLLGRTWWANQRCATYAGLLAELARCEPSPFRDRLQRMAAQAQRLTREP